MVYDDRPPEFSPPPIQIYHPTFTKFLSLATSKWNGEPDTLRKTSKFIQDSRNYYDGKNARRDSLLPSLQQLVHPEISNSSVFIEKGKWIHPEAILSVHVGSKPKEDPVCAFIHIVNEVGTGSPDPVLQSESAFVLTYSAVEVSPLLDPSIHWFIEINRGNNCARDLAVPPSCL